MSFKWPGIIHHLLSSPISDRKYINGYIKTLRRVECCFARKNNVYYFLAYIYYLHKLRKYSRITGFQIPPNTVGEGLTIWHWGPIIINPKTKIGINCTLYPGVLIGHKEEGQPAPIIGDNVFICSGAKIIGNVHIGNNVVIGHNCVVTHDIPDNTKVVVGKINRILDQNENSSHM